MSYGESHSPKGKNRHTGALVYDMAYLGNHKQFHTYNSVFREILGHEAETLAWRIICEAWNLVKHHRLLQVRIINHSGRSGERNY